MPVSTLASAIPAAVTDRTHDAPRAAASRSKVASFLSGFTDF
jgi:hypothetical protein